MELNDTSANSEQVSTDDPFIMWIFGLNTSMFFLYWTVGALYMLMDTYNLPLWSQFKTQPGKNEPVDWIKLRKVIKRVIYNQTIVALMLTIPAYSIVVWNGGNLLNIREIPSLSTLVIDIFGCMVVREITFYYSHRLLHHRKFYEKYHKKHHEYTAPVAVSAQYADSFEHVVSNLLPVLIGPETVLLVVGSSYQISYQLDCTG
uniref:CSON010391 protein n=1 Tax=Culicoides sonorensis TaxID=179676 RepID=A0A336LL23_CULSO